MYRRAPMSVRSVLLLLLDPTFFLPLILLSES